MIYINYRISIDEREIREDFIRSSGPGGQNVNKVATAVQLRFDVGNSPSLPDDVRARLITLAGRRITKEGELVIKAARFRTQEHNRRDATERLVDLIRKAAAPPPKPRRETRPSKASKERRMDRKHRQGELKTMRRPVIKYDE
ncbi:MAG: aminoacyl-tRNA hydrolase [Deltaproteobacteria bacterium]|nr:aminoacyl-tRNA hydrolase [Deltaproteobacteria bacterium]